MRVGGEGRSERHMIGVERGERGERKDTGKVRKERRGDER